MNRITQANNLVQQMISTLSHHRIIQVSDYDLEILQQCNNNLEAFLYKQTKTQ